MLIGLAVMAAIVAVGAWLLLKSGSGAASLFPAQTEAQKWKNFSEQKFGFSVDYPAGWALDANYDRYAPGIMDAELNNKKCGLNRNQCAAGCADVRILVGKKPEGGKATGLFSQLYEDFMMVRDFSSASLVDTLELNSKKIFKVADDQVTLAMTGACAGPLYTFDTGSGYFVYVFAGYGAEAADVSADVEKIISSISIK
jgi:hypothetical protein